jgi:hypothetical protein
LIIWSWLVVAVEAAGKRAILAVAAVRAGLEQAQLFQLPLALPIQLRLVGAALRALRQTEALAATLFFQPSHRLAVVVAVGQLKLRPLLVLPGGLVAAGGLGVEQALRAALATHHQLHHRKEITAALVETGLPTMICSRAAAAGPPLQAALAGRL